MKGWLVREKGHPSTALALEDGLPSPEPGPGEALVRVRAGTVNFADILLCQGIYQDRPPLPFTPGLETAGVVEAVGPGVTLAIGDHAAGMSALPAGGYAELALIRANSALVFPPEIPFPQVTLLYTTYQTAHVGLHHSGRLAAGDWLLVLGGAGGVGSAAIQLGRAAGAKVIATAGSPEKIAFCRQMGADVVIDHRNEDLAARLAEITDGHGVDVAFDPVGGAAADIVRRRMAWEGRYLVIGFADGEIPSFPANHILVKNYSVIGVHWSQYSRHMPEVIADAHKDLLRLYAEGAIRPALNRTLGLAEIPDALAALEDRKVAGRLVLVP
ncbi:NADPH:quinone oxidoreductase family protein [Marinibaculum pumilum]|uniref:NADPH:quinone oxidoreductase family protein n=1 Tax=Marinibaculum pumilum TaxID=1766165 RepID=A0ABV7L4V3_9PROT